MGNTLSYYESFASLWDDAPSDLERERPLLAHYTSISTLCEILDKDEIWFSNPLYMNDFEELRFGLVEGRKALYESDALREACRSKTRHELLIQHFDDHFFGFEERNAFDTYVLCFSEHDRQDVDGILSMWRAYGGNGSGAALVFDTSSLLLDNESPFLAEKVYYGTREERTNWIGKKLTRFAEILASTSVPDEHLSEPAFYLFERMKLFALFSKHAGFKEEREWRVVYLSERDQVKKFESMLGYAVSSRGVQPKLKLKLNGEFLKTDLSLEKTIDRILLGPSLSSELAVRSVRRMMEKTRKASLVGQLMASSIPFRPT